MRNITEHEVNPANQSLSITVIDEPGHGGASHHYAIDCGSNETVATDIKFQNGPIAEAGVNGLTHEVLIAILCDRLRGFQAGAYANQFNAVALLHLELAQKALQSRTRERMERGVEGTHTV